MILSAGLGTRMAPLSETRAKPALCVLGEPLVMRLIRQLARQEVDRVVVNTHEHAAQIRKAVSKSPIPVEISHEPELCGSGGGVLRARAFLDGEEPFLLVNGDMCTEVDVPALLAAHASLGAAVTLLLRDEARKHEFGSIGYAEGGLVSRITDIFRQGSENGSGLFTGVHAIEPRVFNAMPERQSFSILSDVYVPLLRDGGRIGSCLQRDTAQWWPVGTPGELLDANLRALRLACAAPGAPADGVIAASGARIEGELRGPVWLGPGARVERGACAGPGVVIEAGATLPEGASATDTLLLADACPRDALRLERAVGYDHEVWRDA